MNNVQLLNLNINWNASEMLPCCVIKTCWPSVKVTDYWTSEHETRGSLWMWTRWLCQVCWVWTCLL